MPRSVHATKEYGKLRFHLSERMVEQGLNRNQIAQAIGSRFEVVDKWCSDGPERIDADVLARLCYVLECGVGDTPMKKLKEGEALLFSFFFSRFMLD